MKSSISLSSLDWSCDPGTSIVVGLWAVPVQHLADTGWSCPNAGCFWDKALSITFWAAFSFPLSNKQGSTRRIAVALIDEQCPDLPALCHHVLNSLDALYCKIHFMSGMSISWCAIVRLKHYETGSELTIPAASVALSPIISPTRSVCISSSWYSSVIPEWNHLTLSLSSGDKWALKHSVEVYETQSEG